MPLNIIGSMIVDGPDVVPGWQYIKTYGPIIATIGSLKYYFRGATNTWDRDLHGKVFIITGGTSGLGSSIVDELASRGAQLILLVRSTNDSWVTEKIEELREKHDNYLIYAEECDLSSLYSIRKFATKWLDNVPPRRLDGIVCTAAESLPAYKERENSVDGIEMQTAVSYVGHYHLLTLLQPSLKAQLADRDVRVILTTCLSQAMGDLDIEDPLFINRRYPKNSPWTVLGTAKLELGLFAKEFQRRLEAVPRKDGAPCNIRVNVVNPGTMRSPSTKRVLSFGSIWGLLLYVVLLPILWIFLRSTNQGAQSFFHALMCPEFIGLPGGQFISNCAIYKPVRKELEDEELQKKLYDNTAAAIAVVEKESAMKRKREESEKQKKKGKDPKKTEDEKVVSGLKNRKVKISTLNDPSEKDTVPLFPEFDKNNKPIINGKEDIKDSKGNPQPAKKKSNNRGNKGKSKKF
ncbi:hypothetical protein WICPIJ_009305 [Wickerhamomyces pijperi]|uniref:Ketoreductase (KR) domain-containing protein n=1 Tax=Wickerhamomyces pijperi TaxID=599730 RepID=A0A9P8PQ86_WICPI|nr:hypothetical protein WICPIJ_009305 [Wickerhamomyces pijperi]